MIHVELCAPGYSLAQTWSLWVFGELANMKNILILSLPLFISPVKKLHNFKNNRAPNEA